MIKEIINIGTSANSGDGDPDRVAWEKTKNNIDNLFDAKSITGDAKFDSPVGNFGESPTTPRTVASIPLNKTNALSAGTCGIYFKGAVLNKNNFSGGSIVLFSGVNTINELCLIWIIYDKPNNCFHVNIQTGFTGDLGGVIETSPVITAVLYTGETSPVITVTL